MVGSLQSQMERALYDTEATPTAASNSHCQSLATEPNTAPFCAFPQQETRLWFPHERRTAPLVKLFKTVPYAKYKMYLLDRRAIDKSHLHANPPQA